MLYFFIGLTIVGLATLIFFLLKREEKEAAAAREAARKSLHERWVVANGGLEDWLASTYKPAGKSTYPTIPQSYSPVVEQEVKKKQDTSNDLMDFGTLALATVIATSDHSSSSSAPYDFGSSSSGSDFSGGGGDFGGGGASSDW